MTDGEYSALRRPLKVLVAHHYYRSTAPSGENAAVRRDIAMLREAGHEVRELARSSDELTARRLVASWSGVRAREPVAELRALLGGGWRPDVLHAHNLFPLLTTGPLRWAAAEGVPVVHTLHNYRRTCAAGTHFRDGRICDDCTGRRIVWPALVHGCYRGSPVQTLPVVLNQCLDRQVWARVDAFLALTGYQKDRIVSDLGVPGDAVLVRPTAVPDPGPASPPGTGAVYVGRLSPEKGVDLLLDAWQAGDLGRASTLEVIGDGPDSEQLQRLAAGMAGVRLLGRRDPVEVAAHLRRAALVVIPSRWNEGFPTVAAEAFAHGRAVLALDLPNLRAIVGSAGWLAPADPAGLARALGAALADRRQLIERGELARRRYLREMTMQVSGRQLLATYDLAARRRAAADAPDRIPDVVG